ncbi:hypothetical protein [Butyrivibrio sp. YAB3001]|uniref:hypothetical protein n=1 Tax=Butyrivibrio sp. YAB3001 TaxID=1520812 RepID=UPI00158813CB|nr:hypothetical protein [Butyrivibrio sp. YAB3001]
MEEVKDSMHMKAQDNSTFEELEVVEELGELSEKEFVIAMSVAAGVAAAVAAGVVIT